jgi:hypothetical protein
MSITHQQDKGREAVVLRKTLIPKMKENLLKRRGPPLRFISDTTSSVPLYLIEEREKKVVVAKEKNRKRYRQYGY